jgi:hypothetical protein
MKQNQIDEGRIGDHGHGLGTVTREMVEARAREIALINGRDEGQVLDSDVVQARRELQGQERLNPVPTMAESLREDQRWDPIPGSPGYQAPNLSTPDEQTDAEKLIEEGIADAEHDLQVAASRLRQE